MSTVVDNLLECITLEICNEKNKNIVISCIYRATGTNIDLFRKWMEGMYSQKSNKTVYIRGDFNIDLLNPHKLKTIDDFINTMYSLSLFPKITRPTRITSNYATLIDNIYSNDIENKTLSGILVNDISDHLPVFSIYDFKYRVRKTTKQFEYRQFRTKELLNKFKDNLLAHNWETVYQEKDVNNAYEKFSSVFKHLYERNCPLIKCIQKRKHKNCPWLTKGLQNTYKKKNMLYREFIRWRNKEAEDRYKKYKN